MLPHLFLLLRMSPGRCLSTPPPFSAEDGYGGCTPLIPEQGANGVVILVSVVISDVMEYCLFILLSLAGSPSLYIQTRLSLSNIGDGDSASRQRLSLSNNEDGDYANLQIQTFKDDLLLLRAFASKHLPQLMSTPARDEPNSPLRSR